MINEFDYNLEIKCRGCGNFIRVTGPWVNWPNSQEYGCGECGRRYTLETFNKKDERFVIDSIDRVLVNCGRKECNSMAKRHLGLLSHMSKKPGVQWLFRIPFTRIVIQKVKRY